MKDAATLDHTYSRLISELGYEASSAFVAEDDDPRTAHVYRVAAKAGVVRTYTLRTSEGDNDLPRSPVVFVARATNEERARHIRRSLWCLGYAPFTIIVLPGQVRAYANSCFDPADPGLGLLGTWDNLAEAVSLAIRELHADQIDTGRIWASRSQDIHTEHRVDWHLLNNLRKLSEHLTTQLHVPLETAHALIGKYIYIRYLRDRHIVTDKWLIEERIDPDAVFGEGANISDLRRLVEALDARFNGSIFPLALEGDRAPSNQAIELVARTIAGHTPWSAQYAFDFSLYDFSYIPIETLSVIYEQFLGERNAQRRAGAFYTPEPIADYLLAELETAAPSTSPCRVLDPSCGSGIFLVLYYRQLIERFISRTCRTPTLQELKQLLQSHIFGVERNREACYVTEFSLLLTLLHYVDPPQLEHHRDFRFPTLRGENIFHADFFDEALPLVTKAMRFDRVVGNPPWSELDPTDSDSMHAIQYMESVAHICPVKRYRVHEAFLWRARDFLADNGCIAFIVHATTLTNEQSAAFRQSFFTSNEVLKITNFTNFAYRLFPTSEAPAFTVVYRPTTARPVDRPHILHYGPFVANQLPLHALTNKQGTPLLSIYQADIRTVDPVEAATGSAMTWKFALWASYREEQAYKELRASFTSSLQEYVDDRGWKVRLGVQIRRSDADESVTYSELLATVPRLNVAKFRASGAFFQVRKDVLEPIPIEERYVREGRSVGLEVARAPHVYLSDTFAAYSDLDFVLPHPHIGIAAPRHDERRLRAISLLLWSSVCRFLLFFDSSALGVFTNTLGVQTARRLPLPQLSDDQAAQLAEVHKSLCESPHDEGARYYGNQDHNGFPTVGNSEQRRIDDAVASVLQLPEQIDAIARDFVQVKFRLNKGKRPTEILRAPRVDELRNYGATLISELEQFAGVRHHVELRQGSEFTICRVSLWNHDLHGQQNVIVGDLDQTFGSPWSTVLKSRESQMAYVRRNFTFIDKDSITLLKWNRLLDWTRSCALLDSDDLIAEMIEEAGRSAR